MPIAITDDHRRLGEVVGAFLADRGALAESRRLIEEDDEQLPSFWKEFAELGWLGLHLPEAVGGSGYTLAELAIVLEQLGRVVAPGPIVATTWSSAVMARSKATEDIRDVLRSLAEGTAVGAVALGGGVSIEKGHAVGDAGVVLGAGLATVLLVAAGDDMAVIAAPAEDVIVTPHKNLDPTRRAASVSLAGAPVAAILPGARATAVAIGRALAAAEASGSGAACVEMATDYAKVRKQFNRVIGTFQAVKHHAANMLVASELAAAATWDAARRTSWGRSSNSPPRSPPPRRFRPSCSARSSTSRSMVGSDTRGSTMPTSTCGGRGRWRPYSGRSRRCDRM